MSTSTSGTDRENESTSPSSASVTSPSSGSSRKLDLPPELTPFSKRKGNIEAVIFVNTDKQETMIYPLHTNDRFPDFPTLRKEQWVIRRVFAEMMLDPELSERAEISRLHYQLTKPINHDEDSTGRLSWLPSGVLFRIFNELDPLSLLALAVTSFRLLKLTTPHVRDVIMPPHVGSWAGDKVQCIQLTVDSNLHIQGRGRTSAYIENYCNYQRWTKGYRIVEPLRSFVLPLGREGIYDAERILAGIIGQIEQSPGRLNAIREFITGLQYGDEFWLSFHRERKYWFNKVDSVAFSSGEITVFDLHKWVSADGPGRLDENSLPTSVFGRGMHFLGQDSFFSKSNWAGEPWKIVPCDDHQDDTLGLAPLARAEKRQRMVEDILLRDEGGRVSKIPRSGDETGLPYRSIPDSRRKVALSRQYRKKVMGARALFILVALCWALQAGVFSELWYFVTLGWWVFTGKEIEGGIQI
ncbi:hypothetical protein TWF506_004648 [Arthrobotrys conoides]|uniref:F-box domain-containing protein n=1 Tax=Arthrobotrys conoides TaxID=74498 RepID=A0AAN8MWC3_9PEZI